MCRAVFCCKQGTECSGYTKGVQFLDQLTDCEEDQEAFRPTYCVTIRMLSTSRRSVPRLCGQSEPISISYTFDGNLSREKKINPLNAELNLISHLLALLLAHHILHVSGIRVNVVQYLL